MYHVTYFKVTLICVYIRDYKTQIICKNMDCKLSRKKKYTFIRIFKINLIPKIAQNCSKQKFEIDTSYSKSF